MATPTTGPGGITLPLPDATRAAYEDLYNKAQAAIESTVDPDLLTGLNDARDGIDDILSADDAFRLNANSAAFADLTKKIGKVNDGLTALQTQIAAVAKTLGRYSAVAGAIGKVLSMFPV